MSSHHSTDIPGYVAISIGLKPRPASHWHSRAGQAEWKEEKMSWKPGYVPVKKEKKPKVIRMRAGRLADLMDMPLDIFLEILSHLEPIDLIRLSRSSKHFRSMLMTRRARYLWDAAFRNVDPQIPPCPPYISSPRYAAALFDHYCFACGIERSTNTDFTHILRLCAPCFKTNFKPGNELALRSKRLSTEFVEKTLPTLLASVVYYYPPLHDNNPGRGGATNNCIYHTFYVPEVKAVIATYQSLQTPEEQQAFIAGRRAYVDEKQLHGISVLRWLSKTYRQKWADEDEARKDRKEAMLRKLEALGYSGADYPDNDAWKKILDQPRRLTDRIWKAARPKLEALIKQKHEDDRQAEFEARLKERYVEFRPIYEEFVHAVVPQHLRDFAPNWTDACRLPCIVELASSDGGFPRVTFDRVAAIDARLATEVLDSIYQIKRDLVEMLHREHCRVHPRDAQPMPHLEMEQVDAELAKATSLFVCHRCPLQIAASASQICLHWRTEHPELKWNDGWPIKEIFDRRRRRSEWPEPRPWVCAMPYGPSLAKRALDTFGLPEDTPFALLDDLARQGRLVCLCRSPQLQPPRESGWGTLISHVHDEQGWYQYMSDSLPRGYPPTTRLIDNHVMSGPNSCLKLLEGGEQAAFPDYDVPATTAAEVAAKLESDRRKPTCASCHYMVREDRQRYVRKMKRDVAYLAHHMKTRHDKVLTERSIMFTD
ncbi:hypothetical protein C8Q73DRAFT_796049 [Cubamyces lactineus]|nr:hypothetical protein C8Q73DRAFT_796049 [Cubamyces lactineus]